MDVFEEALSFAIKVHSGQKRKNGSPYILHPLECATIAATLTNDKEVLAAVVLHDTVEDTPVTSEDVERLFGRRVAQLVASETEDKRSDLPPMTTWRIRKEESLLFLKNTSDVNVKILWLSDKLSNMRSFYHDFLVEGAGLWNKFNQKDESQQRWYYLSVAELTSELKETLAWKEYCDILKKVFKEKCNG